MTRYDLTDLKALDAVSVAERLGLQLKKQGQHHVAYCPNHDDRNRPNLVVSSEKGTRCFACGWRPSTIDLVMVAQGVDFPQAVSWLGEAYGLQPVGGTRLGLGDSNQGHTVRTSPNSRDRGRQQPSANGKLSARGRVARQLGDIQGGQTDRLSPNKSDRPAVPFGLRVKVYSSLLSYCRPAGPPNPSEGAAWLLREKGISYATQAAFGVRWLEDYEGANQGLQATFGTNVLRGLGLLSKKGHLLWWRHRLVFPFWKHINKPVYLQARNIDADDQRGRFLVPTGYPPPCLYNVDEIGEAHYQGQAVFIAEGPTDTLTLNQVGHFAVGIVGAQGFRPEWVSLFDGLDVYLAFDPDRAGQEAALTVAQTFEDAGRLAPRIVTLPQGQDVTDLFTGQQSKKPAGQDGNEG